MATTFALMSGGFMMRFSTHHLLCELIPVVGIVFGNNPI